MKFLTFILILQFYFLCAHNLTAQWKSYGVTFDAAPEQFYFDRISARDSQNIWALIGDIDSDELEYAYSIDGGKSFNKFSFEFTPDLIVNDIWAVDKNSAFILREELNDLSEPYKSSILKTTNSGKEWKQIFRPSDTANMQSIYFFDQNTGIAFGRTALDSKTISNINYEDTLKLYRTVDGGTTWTKTIISPQLGNFLLMDFTRSYSSFGNNFWISNPHGTILKSDNKGATWSVIDLKLVDKNFNAIEFRDNLNGIASNFTLNILDTSSLNNIYYSTNGGTSWKEHTVPATKGFIIVEIEFYPLLNQYVATGLNFDELLSSGNVDFKTFLVSPDGLNWQKASNVIISDLTLAGNLLIGGGFIEDKKGFYRWDKVTSLSRSTIATSLKLDVYPTIAEEQINLKFQNKLTEQVRISILSASGRPEHHLIKEVRQGIDVFSLPVHSLPAGLHLIKVFGTKSKSVLTSAFIKK